MVRSISLLLFVAGCLLAHAGDERKVKSPADVQYFPAGEDLPNLKRALKIYRQEQAAANAGTEAQSTPKTEPEGFSLEVSPLLPNGKPAPLSYLTLWRALEPGEKDPVSGVKAPGGLKYYDSVIWIDQEHKTRWVRARSAHPNDGRHGWEEKTFRFTGLPAGKYRVSAVTYPPKDRKLRRTDPTPHGVSDPVELGDEGNQQVSVKVRLEGTAPLVLHATDAETGSDLSGLVLRLRNSEGLPIVLGSGTGNYFERTNEEGEVVYSRLQPGEYTVEVFGRRAYLNEFVQYEPLDEPIRFQVTGNQPNLVEISVPPRKLTAAEIKERFPFYVYGRVTDENGQPIENVEVRAATGMGTLMGGGTTHTDANGRYRLYFGAGMSMAVSAHSPLGVGTQAAVVSARKEGWYETNFNRQGDLCMSDQPPTELEGSIKQDGKVYGKTSIEQFVLPNVPREVNFTLARAATIEGTLEVDGREWKDVELYVVSEEIPDRQPLYASATTGRDGEFQLNDLARGLEYRFGMRISGTRNNVRSQPFTITEADVYRFVVSLDSESGQTGAVTLRLSCRPVEDSRK